MTIPTKTSKFQRYRSNVFLFIAALIWGTAFVAQREGVDVLHPITYNGIRNFVGCIALMPVILIMTASSRKKGTQIKMNPKTLIIGGIICGIILFTASTLQTMALVDADEGKAGFMTALYLIIVPIIGIFMGKKVRPVIWISVVLATFGLYFLCVKEGTSFSFNKSELLLLACAFVFALHIIAIDYFSPKVDGVKLSFIQFFVVGIISLVYIIAVDRPSFEEIKACTIPILYAGVMSSGVAYTFQILGQKNAEPAVASIIMSMESLFALLAGILISGNEPGVRAIAGCAFMMVAIILVELPERKPKKQ